MKLDWFEGIVHEEIGWGGGRGGLERCPRVYDSEFPSFFYY